MDDWIKILLPGILTVILNVIFYLLIKRWVEKSMEKFKIAYSGIFLEKIKIYQQLLEKTVLIKREIRNYSFEPENTDPLKIQNEILNFHYFSQANKPFISKELIDFVDELYIEYKQVFTPIHFYNEGNNKDSWYKKYRESIKLIHRNEAFFKLEEKINVEMRKELKTDKS